MSTFHPDDCHCRGCMSRMATQLAATAERLDNDPADQYELEHFYPELVAFRRSRKHGEDDR